MLEVNGHCQRLGELRKALGDCAAGFDANLISASDAARVVDHASAIEKMAATLKALAAARVVADTELWRRNGDRSAAHELARRTGTTVSQAAQALEAGKRLRNLPDTEAAAKRGDLSAQQAAAIADAASTDPSSEAKLLEQAQRGSLQELRDECARTKAASCPDSEARRSHIHRHRFLRSYTDCEGAFNLRLRENPEVGARVMAKVEAKADLFFRKARAEGRREALEAYAADALVALVLGEDETRETKGTPRAKILVRVDLDALLRGYPAEGETTEIAGHGPVAVSAIEDLMATGSAFLAGVVTKGKEVVGVAHMGRRPSAHQQSALEWLYPTCAVEGCSSVARLEMDHRVEWARSRFTVVDLLDRLCHHHHRLKTTEGWAMVEGKGKRAFLAPDDPRHPHNANAPPGAA